MPDNVDPIRIKLNELKKSPFRLKFHLSEKDKVLVQSKGIPIISQHARELVFKRLAPALPVKDGKQTPFKGYPVFIAQHATATCCRGCLSKWHKIPKGKQLSDKEIDYVVRVITEWIKSEL